MNFMRHFKVICVFVAMLAAMNLSAGYLYWQVDEADFEGESFTYDGARVVAFNNDSQTSVGTYYYVSDGEDGHGAGEYVLFGDGYVDFYPDPNGRTTGDVYADLGDLTGDSYLYFIELITYDESGTITQVATSKSSTWADISGHITDELAPGALAPWHGAGFTGAVPEPTSGMLVLLGVGVAAFKKRRTLKDWLKRKG